MAAICLIAASSASAATEFGDNCVGNVLTESEPLTVFDVSAPGNPLPVTAPSAGIITKWKVNLVPAPVLFPQTLRVLRQNGANTVLTIAEATGNIIGGPNSFDTRIPVQAGDRVSLFGSNAIVGSKEAGNLVCQVSEKTVYGGFTGSGGGVGSTNSFVTAEGEARIPVSAVVEPDADNDGYGDETQDKCPQSAAVQVACVPVTLSATGVARKGLASITVTANSQATVTVKGTVQLGKGKKAKLGGGTQVVAPGTLAKFTILFPQKVRSALKALPSKKSLTLKVTVSAPNVTGPASTKTLKLHLKGQAKPKRHSHKKRA